MGCSEFSEIAEKLKEADSVYLFPHENPDGDALGSCAALLSMLRGMGKKCEIFVDEPIPDNLTFMDTGDVFTIGTEGFEPPDIAMAVDCGTRTRFPKREALFSSAKFTICMDHHIKEDDFTDLWHIDPKAAATGELVYKLMSEMGHEPTKYEGEALFAAITTDTGNFQYSNTTKETHEIACHLYDIGIDVTYVSTELYQNVSKSKLMLESRAVEGMQVLGGGKVAYTMVTQSMLDETGANMSDAEQIVTLIRSVKGVEIALLFKERPDGKVFVSMRSKTTGDVQKIAAGFGGGGHKKAAGCTLAMPLPEVVRQITKAAVESLK